MPEALQCSGAPRSRISGPADYRAPSPALDPCLTCARDAKEDVKKAEGSARPSRSISPRYYEARLVEPPSSPAHGLAGRRMQSPRKSSVSSLRTPGVRIREQ